MKFAAVFLVVLLGFSLSAAAAGSFTTHLAYGSGPGFDSDNNGIERKASIIDYSVSVSGIVDESTLCTWWDVYSIDQDSHRSSCYGPIACCNSIGLDQLLPQWNSSYYLAFGKDGSTSKNIVSANVVSYDVGVFSSQASYGSWKTLSGMFVKQGVSVIRNLSNASLNLTLFSPDNSSTQSQGDLVLNFSVEGSAAANISIAGRSFTLSPVLSGNTSWFYQRLPLLSSGMGNISFNITLNQSQAIVEYIFQVNDTTPPLINVSTLFNQTVVSESSGLPLVVNSSENSSLIVYQNSVAVFNLSNNFSFSFNASLLNSSNLFTVSVSDISNNTANYTFFVNFTQNLSAGFSAVADKQRYNISEQILLYIAAPLNSSYNITITGPSYLQTTNFQSQGPITYFFYIVNAGNYTINTSFTYKTLINKTVVIPVEVISHSASNLTMQVSSNVTTVDEGGSIFFNSTISGNTSQVTYRWDFNGDGIIDSQLPFRVYNYSTNGSYSATLNVSDGLVNLSSSIQITVRKLNNLTILLVDNSTAQAVESSTVTFDSSAFNVSANGSLMVVKQSGSYSLQVSADGYFNHSSTVQLYANSTVTISMTRMCV